MWKPSGFTREEQHQRTIVWLNPNLCWQGTLVEIKVSTRHQQVRPTPTCELWGSHELN